MTDSKKPKNEKWVVCTHIFDKKWVHFNRLWVNMVSIRMIVKLGTKNELQNLGFRTYYNQCAPTPSCLRSFWMSPNQTSLINQTHFRYSLIIWPTPPTHPSWLRNIWMVPNQCQSLGKLSLSMAVLDFSSGIWCTVFPSLLC